MSMQRRFGRYWGAFGAALRVCSDPLVDRDRPALLNESWDCQLFCRTFPEFSAVGDRTLEPGLVNRIVFEVRADPTNLRHICQVGVGCVQGEDSLRRGRLDECTTLLASLVYTSVGDVLSTDAGTITVASSDACGLKPRASDWISGAPPWLTSHAPATVMLEVDLHRGTFSVNVGNCFTEPPIVAAPGLCSHVDKAWRPFISLTAVGQEARILSFTVFPAGSLAEKGFHSRNGCLQSPRCQSLCRSTAPS